MITVGAWNSATKLSAMSQRGLLFRLGVSVTSDEVGMVPTGRRADSL
jgi:hypothetical protein